MITDEIGKEKNMLLPQHVTGTWRFRSAVQKWSDASMRKEWLALLDILFLQTKQVSCGTTRITFIGETHVYKAPWNPDDQQQNRNEFAVYQKLPFPCAPCELDVKLGITVVKMARVEIDKDFNPYERKNKNQYPWVTLVGDGAQVGFLNNELVAFDYAHCWYDNAVCLDSYTYDS
jgi:hypothetical protein